MTVYNPSDDNPIQETDRVQMHPVNPQRSLLDPSNPIGSNSGWTWKTIFEYLGTNLWAPNPLAGLNMTWHNQWQQRNYLAGSVVVDGVYLMCANKVTADRPAPVSSGPAAWITPDAPTWATNSPSAVLVASGIRFTAPSAQLVTGLRFWIPATGAEINYQIVFRDVTDPANPVVVRTEQIFPLATGWFVVNLAGFILTVGKIYESYLLVSDDTSAAPWQGRYTFRSGTANVTPNQGEIYHKENDGLLRVHEVDENLVNQATNLDLVVPGTNIEYEASAIQQVVDDKGSPSPNVREYGVNNVAGSPLHTIQDVIFHIPVAQTTTYVSEAAAAVTNTVGILSIDGAPFTADDTLYGADLQIQPVTASEDWDVMSVTTIN